MTIKRIVTAIFAFPLLLVVGLIGGEALIALKNKKAERIVAEECNADRVFQVLDAAQWQRVEENFKTDRRNLENPARLETPVAGWKDDAENPSVRRATLILRSEGRDVLRIRDVAYAPRSILSELGLVQRVIGFHCLQNIKSKYTDIFYNFGKI